MPNDLNIRIKINSDTKALEVTQDGIAKVSDSALKASGGVDHFSSSINNSINSVKNLALSYIGLNALLSSSREIINTADDFNRLDGRLKLATDSVQEFNSQQKELLSLANETHTPLKSLTDLYIKLDPALEKLGATTETSNRISESFAKGLKLGGSNATESSSAILQFSQAMGSGVLRGDEFNSMMEASPKLMAYMAKGMDVPIGSLRQMAENGELTAGKVSAALLKMSDEIDRDFKQLPKTVGDSVVDFKTNMGVMISEVDQATGVTSSLSDGITELSSVFSSNSGDVITMINTVREYSGIIEGLAVTYGVMAVASKSAAAVELWYSEIKAISTAASSSRLAIITAETEAQTLGTYATAARTLADRVNITGVLNNTIATTAQISALNAEATAAEAAALAQTNHAYALRSAGVSAGLMGTALKAIPFIAVASTVLLLASSFFESKKQSDDLNNSLNATTESLSKLTKAQLENKRQNLSLELQSSGLELRQLKQKYGAKSGRTVEQQAEIDDLEAYIKSLNDAGKNIAVAQTKIRDVSTTSKTGSTQTKAPPSLEDQIAALQANGSAPDSKAIKAAEKAAEKKKKEAERQAKEQYDLEVKHLDLQQNAILDYYKTIGDASSVYAIEEAQKLQTLASSGILTNEQMIDVWLKDNETFAWQNSELERETDKKILATHIKTIEDKRAALLDYYTQIGDTSSAFEISESDKIQKLAELGIYTNEQMLAIWTKDNETYQKDQFEKNNKFWVGLFDNVNKAMESQFFDVMTGRFNSFGSWLKDLWSSITDSMSRGLSKTLADAILGTGTDGGGLQNIFKTYGGLGSVFGSSMTPAALLGSNTDATGFTTTSGGTVFDAAGQITKSGSDAESVISALSNAKSLYSIATDGITGYMGGIAGNLANAAGWLNGMGFTAGGNFLTGAGSIFAGNGMLTSSTASMLGGGLTAGALGGVGGYALGSLGDALFGANTKAASYGAIGGSIGAIAGSIVPGLGTLLGGAIGSALGSVIGGMFGSTKATGSGYYFNSDTTTGSNGQSYIDYKKKSWFSSSSWTDYTNLSDVDKLKVKGMFDTYNYLFTQLGSSNIVELSAGKYSGTKFQDELAKDFIAKYIGIDKTISVTTTELIRSFGKQWNLSLLGATKEVTKITDNPEFTKIYAYWTDYAKSINKTVAEALTSSVGTYISETRTFSEWKFGSGTVDQLKFTADYLAKDLAALETQMGVSGVTVDNYLSMYDEAIKKSFTPETISSWKALGDAIMSNTDAADAYTNALKEQAAVSSKMAHQDMLLSKVTSVAKNEGESLSAQLLVQVVKELQSLRTDTLFQVGTA